MIEVDNMPITKKKDGYYWGSKGPFKTRKKAVQVAQAAYASGYVKKSWQDILKKDSNKRIHRKKGEPETSKKNTDLYVDRDKNDTVPISFKNRQAVKDTFRSPAFRNASHQRQSLVVGVTEQRARAAKKRAKDTKKKKDLAQAEQEAKKKRQQLKRKTKRMKA